MNDLEFLKELLSVRTATYNEELMVQYRLAAVLNMVYSDNRYNPYIDKDTESKVLCEYLNNYKQYKLV